MENSRHPEWIGLIGSLAVHAIILLPLLLWSSAGSRQPPPSNSEPKSFSVTLLASDEISNSQKALAPVSGDAKQLSENIHPTSSPSTQATAASQHEAKTPSKKLAHTPTNNTSSSDSSFTSTSDHPSAVIRNEDLLQYQNILLAHIARYQGYPSEQRNQRVEGIVQLSFAMNRQGGLLDIWVDHSSGVGALDNEAIATVRRAQPLPNIPRTLPDQLTVQLPVSFSVQ